MPCLRHCCNACHVTFQATTRFATDSHSSAMITAFVSGKNACGAGLKWVPVQLIFSQSNQSTTHCSQPRHNPMRDKESALSVHSSLLALIIRTFYKAPVSIAIGAGCWPTVGALPLKKLNGSALTLARVRCPGPG